MRQLTIVQQITNRESLSLEKYLGEVAKITLITADEEEALASKIRRGDQKAREVLIKANLRFVVSVAKHYQNMGFSLADLINEGNLGLIKAAERFDETRGFKFISYAVWWIRQSILKALNEQAGIVRIPFNRVGKYNQIARAFAKLEQDYQREPSPDEISEMIDIQPSLVGHILNSTNFHVSMDAPLREDEDVELSMYDVLMINDTPSPEKRLIDHSLKKDLERVLATLSDREAEILRLSYGLSGKAVHTLFEIGMKLNITRERVRQIKNNALIKLQCFQHKELLKTHVA